MSKRTWIIILIGTALYAALLLYPLFRNHTAEYAQCLIRQAATGHAHFPKTIDQHALAQLKATYGEACDEEQGEDFMRQYLLASISTLVILGVSGLVHGARRRKARHDTLMDAIRHIVTTEINMGDVFKGVSNSTIINRSRLENSILKAETTDPGLARSIAELSRLVAQSNNAAAEKALNGMTAEIVKPAPEKHLVGTYWEIIKSLLPSLKDMVDITVGIEGFLK